MHVIDAMDLEEIGRAVAAEFSDRDDELRIAIPSFVCEWRGDHVVSGHPCPGRVDAERLVAVLERLGFRIVKEDPCA